MMQRRKRHSHRPDLTVFLAALSLICFASLPLTAQHAPNSEWRQIELDDFTIIFEAGNEATAQDVAADLEHYMPAMADSLNLDEVWGPFPIVLSSSSHQSNGWVRLPLRSSYFYNKPATFMGSNDWHTGLVIHEGRHIQQVSLARDTTLGTAMFYYAGEMGTAGVVSLRYPDWFLEGDAVLNETLWTPGGRGRIARFTLWPRTRELSGGRYDFYRAYLGTGQDDTPHQDYYALGYILVTYFNRHYGADFFAGVMEDTGNTLSPLTFSGHIADRTGMSLPEHYQRAMDEMRDLWQAQLANVQVNEDIEVLSPETQNWHAYMPIGMNGDVPLALSRGPSRSPHLVRLDDEGPEPIISTSPDVYRGYEQGDRIISQGGSRLCWIRNHENRRFHFVSYGDLACVDQNTTEVTQYTEGRKLVDVATHPQGNQWLVSEYTETREAHLELLNSSGQTVRRWEQPVGSYLHDLSWHDSGEQVLFTRLDRSGFSLHRLDIESGDIQQLIAPTTDEVIRNVTYARDWVFYTSDYTGIDQIWALNPANGERYLAIQRPFGAYFPLWDEARQRLLFSDYTANGDQVVAHTLPESWPAEGWIAFSQVAPERVDYFAPLLTEQHQAAADQAQQPRPDPSYPVRNYERGENALNVHSWGIGTRGTDEVTISLASSNLLQTLDLNAAAGYDFRDGHLSASLDIESQRWFPIMGGRVARDYVSLNLEDDELEWRQTEVTGRVSIPLSGWEQDAYRSVSSNLSLSYVDLEALGGQPGYSGTLLSLGTRFGQRYLGGYHDARAGQDGFSGEVRWSTSIDALADFSWQEIVGGLRLGMPGLRPLDNTSVRLNLYRQFTRRGLQVPLFRSATPRPRGYVNSLAGTEGGLVAADYQIALGTLDKALWKALYLRRLAMEVSADHEFARIAGETVTQSSVGSALVVPINLFSNLNLQIDTRTGLYYQLEEEEFAVNITLGLAGF